MYNKRINEGVAVPASLRMNDGTVLVGTINCGASGKLENLLASEVKFIEFVSKDGHQRFLAHHQIAAIEPLQSLRKPALPIIEDDETFEVLGLETSATLDEANAAYQKMLALYNAERWANPDVPFEFTRYASQKIKQVNAAYTTVKASILQRTAAQAPARPSRFSAV